MAAPLTAGLQAALDLARSSAQAWPVVFDKSRVLRQDVPLGFDPGDYRAADYDAVIGYLAPLAARAAKEPMSASGLRWCYQGAAVLFEASRVLNAPYDDLVARVDIAAAIRIMGDYIGGTSTVVSRDRKGRVLRQAERNVYLPQPNWMAFSGGAFIDVCKIEVIRYAEDWQRIAWRTVHSPNGSAVHDDGSVTFRRVGDTQTRVTVCGLQQFTLPPFWAALEPVLAPAVKDALVEEAYRRFFTATLDNVGAAYEGRDFRVGRDRGRIDDESPLARLRATWSAARRPAVVDEDGFRHFAGDGSQLR